MRARLARYEKTTRDPWVAALLVFPVYLLYQLGLALTPGIRNGADLITELLIRLRAWHPEALWALGGALLAAYGVILWRLSSKRRFSASLFPLVALEGAALGLLMFFLINWVMQAILMGGGVSTSLLGEIVLSLGAGFHEELVFRVLLFGGLIVVGQRAFRTKSIWVVLIAAVISSAVFSAIHYIGPLGDVLRLNSFVFRFLAGCFFAAVYRLRGFAVAVYTHAIYDIGYFVFN